MRYSDSQIAQMVLVDSGETPGDAALALLNDAELMGRLADQIAAKRAELDQNLATAARAAFEASPEGRRQAALKATRETQERAQLAASARTLLEAEGVSDAATFTDDEALHASGIERQAAMMSHAERDAAAEALAQRVADGHIKSDAELYAEAEAIEADARTVVSYARSFLGDGEGE